MSVRYLARQYKTDDLQAQPIAQMVNVPQLQQCQRCAWCHYYSLNRSWADYITCSEKHRCGDESLLFATLKNAWHESWYDKDVYTPTTLMKQTLVDYMKRYCQLYSFDVEGYQCNTLCQFYPSRIANDNSIAECSNTNACGRNGSFWWLLQLVLTLLDTMPAVNEFSYSSERWLCLDGSVVEFPSVPNITRDANGFVIASVNGLGDFWLVNMFKASPDAGKFLVARNSDNADYWQWFYTVVGNLDYAKCLVLTNADNYIEQLLVAEGFPRANFTEPLLHLQRIGISSSLTTWFVSRSANFSYVNTGSFYAVLFIPYLSSTAYYVRFGTGKDAWLVCRNSGDDPDEWSRHSLGDDAPTSSYIITITSYNYAFADWLRTIGVRASLFSTL